MEINGFVGDYLGAITDRWLLIAPKSNPGMLEMFRDRDAAPLREMVAWAGEFAGKYLTGAVQVLHVTHDAELKTWLRDFVHTLIDLQDRDGYLGPWSAKDRLANRASNSACGVERLRKRTWDTWGHYHVMLGLMIWHEETSDTRALECATRIADLLCRKYLGKKTPRLVDTGSDEMNLAPAHSLCMLYRKTKNERHLRLALQIVDEFGARRNGKHLAGDYLQQALQGKEFFEIPRPRWESLHPIMGLAELYWITGQDPYRQAFEHLWWSIVKLDRHNNGGFSSGEKATGNPYHLAEIESCCTIAWAAMSVEMLKLTGNSIVADELEFTMFNSIVGMHSSTGRWATYNTPMNGVRRANAHDIVFQSREGTPELNCCSVNTPRGFGLLSEWGLMKDRQGLVLNYYGPSTMTTRLRPGLSVTLVQETEYPLDGTIRISVKPSKPAEFTLKLRVPYWSRKPRILLNGKRLPAVKAGRYLEIERRWNARDKIRIALDMSYHLWRGERECKGTASLYRGPILLAYDHRYNLENAKKGSLQTRVTPYSEKWNPLTGSLDMPVIDATNMQPRRVRWSEWLPPLLLLELKAANGKTVRLCDFGSAGEAGTPYRSWLAVKHCPKATAFSKENPLRTQLL